MSFRNPSSVNFHVHNDFTVLMLDYKSWYLFKKVTPNDIEFNVCIKDRVYKSLSKIKDANKEFEQEFILPIYYVTNKAVDEFYFSGFSVNTTISYMNGYMSTVKISAKYVCSKKDDYSFFEKSDELLFLISINLNHFLTKFAKTFRFNPDPNISFKEYFDSYYNSTNFANIIKNSNGKVLR